MKIHKIKGLSEAIHLCEECNRVVANSGTRFYHLTAGSITGSAICEGAGIRKATEADLKNLRPPTEAQQRRIEELGGTLRNAHSEAVAEVLIEELEQSIAFNSQ